jgi:hypothetical protein
MTKRRLLWTTLAAASFVAALVAPRVSFALHAQSPPVTQVTQQTSGTVGESAVWGNNWAFIASGDSLGNGNSTPELFLYEHILRVLGGALGVSQITCGGFQPAHPSITTPSMGNVIAFDAAGGLCGDPRHNCLPPFDTSAAGRQVFVYYPETSRIRQITRCNGDCVNPHISEGGRFIVFESSADVLGTNGGLPLATTNVYQGNMKSLGPNCPFLPCAPGLANPSLKNLTPVGGGRNAQQNFTGKYVTFESDGDPLATGTVGIPHVYLLEVKSGLLQQIPPGNAAPARNPTIDQGGRRVAYEIDTMRGAPSPGVVTEIWTSKIRKNRTPLTMSLTPNAPASSFKPNIAPAGKRVAFVSTADLLNFQSTGNQLFVYTLIGSKYDKKNLLQVTAAPTGIDSPTQSSYVFTGFSSSGDFIGNGNTVPQFYVANLYRRAPGNPPSPYPGTPTPKPSATPHPTGTPVVGIPAAIGMALVTDQAINNGNNTLTTIIAATVSDFFGNPVPDGTAVSFSVAPPPDGIVVGNGATNQNPDCDLATFAQKTGVPIINRPGVAHVCVTYPGAFGGTTHLIFAESGPQRCEGGSSPDRACTSDFDCDPIHVCSTHTQTVCDPFLGNADCPLGETCIKQDGTCEHSGSGSGNLLLPVPVNECTNNGQPCSDGNPCTLNDVCAGGTTAKACVGGTRAGLACTTVADCPGDVVTPSPQCILSNPPTCQPGAAKTCADDGNLCTSDVCNYLTGACGTPLTCLDDDNPCTDDVCDPTTGTCGVANVKPCSDDDPCTIGDECAAKSCVPGPVMTCPDDGNTCTIDQCNPKTGKCGIKFEPCACSAP